jgi:hypothetical protein
MGQKKTNYKIREPKLKKIKNRGMMNIFPIGG